MGHLCAFAPLAASSLMLAAKGEHPSRGSWSSRWRRSAIFGCTPAAGSICQRDARHRAGTLLAQLTQSHASPARWLPELEPSRGRETAAEGPEEVGHPATEGAQEAPERHLWWSWLFVGVGPRSDQQRHVYSPARPVRWPWALVN